ncbi:glucosaminidase domain-containing protein [Candidatus Dojkabacteria bacterium]|nr:glucosaminidase domain-containing protein [Candidatus Dojkabacteria bacterium]
MTKKVKKITRAAIRRPAFTFKISIIFFGAALIFVALAANNTTEAETSNSSKIFGISTTDSFSEFKELNAPTFTTQSIAIAEQRKQAEIARVAAIKKAQEEKMKHVNKINSFLTKKRSPVANTKIADMLYDNYKSTGTDYRILLAIMGVESGFCNASFSYNCFGYLNGARYPNYEAAFKDLIPKISNQYVKPYGTDFEALAKAYGMVNWQAGAANMRGYYDSI